MACQEVAGSNPASPPLFSAEKDIALIDKMRYNDDIYKLPKHFMSYILSDMRVFFGLLAAGLITGIASATIRLMGEFGYLSGTLPH